PEPRTQVPSAAGTRRAERLQARSDWLSRLVRWLVISDGLIALGAALLALYLRFGERAGQPANTLYVIVTLCLPMLWIGALYLGRCYEHRFLGDGTDEFRRVFEVAIRLFATATIVLYAINWDLARGYAIIVFPLMTAGSLLVHLAGRYLLRRAERD